MEFFNAYEITLNFWAAPWTWNPVEFWTIWYRPIASNFDFSTFDINLYLSTTFECLDFYMTREEHSKVAQKSFIDFFMDISNYMPVPISKSDWMYWEAQAEEYEDPFYTLNVPEKFIPDWADSDWYGEIAIANFWLFERYTW